MTWKDDYAHRMMNTFGVPKVELVRGEGCTVFDSDGKRYLDFLGGIAVNSLGHNHPAVVGALTSQANLLHVSNFFATEPQLALAERLLRISGAGDEGRVFFANSGTEANEAAVKLARLTGRPRILSLMDSFHGRSMGALSITGKASLREPFEPLLPNVEHIDTTIEALAAAIGPDVAALFVEPIKGEAGVQPLPEGYLEAARELTTQHGVLLIVDEIQTGAGRTGRWFGFQESGIVPDAITLAKGIGGGVPIGALVTFGAASALLKPGQHGTTFGGNPLVCAVSNAVLKQIENDDLVANSAARGAQLRTAIEAIGSPLVSELRGRGLLIGIGLSQPVAQQIVAIALDHGLIVNAPNASTVRLAPPLIIGDAEITEFITTFSVVLNAVLQNTLTEAS
ncbi:acetylornithine transaminase [Salinibacterium sp. UTAS2018]|uniref:acetylornithine transaminase n=1 Tax=Salinibacterium sp. UTAS2018 TaxID=2508880 RepID=UPI00100976DC|nr:acetylornithine transaminase [Salinibacterium sp. UTAS2018]QAV68971.1 acetylornithine transaminase [Salinibacterium sp. UTAS2018]